MQRDFIGSIAGISHMQRIWPAQGREDHAPIMHKAKDRALQDVLTATAGPAKHARSVVYLARCYPDTFVDRLNDISRTAGPAVMRRAAHLALWDAPRRPNSAHVQMMRLVDPGEVIDETYYDNALTDPPNVVGFLLAERRELFAEFLECDRQDLTTMLELLIDEADHHVLLGRALEYGLGVSRTTAALIDLGRLYAGSVQTHDGALERLTLPLRTTSTTLQRVMGREVAAAADWYVRNNSIEAAPFTQAVHLYRPRLSLYQAGQNATARVMAAP